MPARLVFDPAKEAANLAKHGIDFSTAARVFEDPDRMIVPNEAHSSDEPRFYAIGDDGRGILTVRFTLGGMPCASLAPGTGANRRELMKTKRKKAAYVDEPSGQGWKFDESKVLTRAQERALGLPSSSAAKKMPVARKPARPARINIRTTHETVAGLRARAEEVGLPYQTLAASVLHMVARGDLKLSLAPAR